MISVPRHMLRSHGVRTTYYNHSLILDTNNIIHKKIHKVYASRDFYPEVKALLTIEKNFKNEPKLDHYPFPKVISFNDDPSLDMLTISMTFCGINAVENACLYSNKQNIKPVNYYNTIECIINNLKNNFIRYQDWKADNVCINEHGQVSLVDFGRYKVQKPHRIERFYKKPNLNDLKAMLCTYVGCSESDFLIGKALNRDADGIWKWKHRKFNTNPWSILYYF